MFGETLEPLATDRWLAYSAKTRFSCGAAKSRRARTLIGRNRLAVYKLTGSVAGWNSSSRVVKAPHFSAVWKWYAKAIVIPMPAHAASQAASALPTSRGRLRATLGATPGGYTGKSGRAERPYFTGLSRSHSKVSERERLAPRLWYCPLVISRRRSVIGQVVRFARSNIQIYDAHVVGL